MRTAPEGGYDFSQKKDYRRKVWATFRDTLKSLRLPVRESHALLMPSLEGDEIDVAIAAGFQEKHLHVVDKEPAIVATLKRRYPKINTYGVTASRAVERISRNGIKLRCLNLDFCYKVSDRFMDELQTIAACGSFPIKLRRKNGVVALHNARHSNKAFDRVCLVAVSTLRGREDRDMTNFITKFNLSDDHLDDMQRRADSLYPFLQRPRGHRTSELDVYRKLPHRDRHRLASAAVALGLSFYEGQPYRPVVLPIRAESYKSSNGQTMLWSVHKITQAEYADEQRTAANARRRQLGYASNDISYAHK